MDALRYAMQKLQKESSERSELTELPEMAVWIDSLMDKGYQLTYWPNDRPLFDVFGWGTDEDEIRIREVLDKVENDNRWLWYTRATPRECGCNSCFQEDSFARV